MGAPISVAVEGEVDAAVARRIVPCAGAEVGFIYGRQGKAYLRQNIQRYNQAARHAPWLVLVDLDREAGCAPRMRQDWLPRPEPRLCFRIAVRAVEAWLLADAEAIATFLRVSRSRVPADPEALSDPKEALVNLARQSPRTAIRQDMTPRPGGERPIGPAYTSRLIEFIAGPWRPEVAAERAGSLERALRCLRLLAESSM